jgi:hypothetical protein
MMNDSCNKENLEVHNVVKSDLNLPEGKSKNDTMVIIIPDGINKVVKNGKTISISRSQHNRTGQILNTLET